MSDVKNFAFTLTRSFVKELRTNWKQNQSNEVNSKMVGVSVNLDDFWRSAYFVCFCQILKVLAKEEKFQILKCIDILSVGVQIK